LEHIATKKDNLNPEFNIHNGISPALAATGDLSHSNICPEKDHNDGDDGDDDDDDGDEDDDPGTSWFSEHNAPEKVLKYLTSKRFPLSPTNLLISATASRHPSILDLGTGNGSMLAFLRKRGGFRGPMVGVDYSPLSVRLARELQVLKLHSAYDSVSEEEEEEEEEEDDDGEVGVEANAKDQIVEISTLESHRDPQVLEVGHLQDIRFEEWDILASGNEQLLDATSSGDDEQLDWFPYSMKGFDIVLDKGTFDAISLCDENYTERDNSTSSADKSNHKRYSKVVQHRVCERYPGITRRLVRPGGFLIVTSCNWTEDEIIEWFTRKGAGGNNSLVFFDRVEYPKFRFGGREGQGVCTVCFQKKI
jgi:EEF1A lysine methyltransferase 2